MNEEFKRFLDIVTEDFTKVSDSLKQCNYHISISEEYEFPIIVTSEDPENELGEVAIKSGELGNKLNYFASYLDYLISAQVIPKNQISEFKKIYEQNSDHCCLLVIHEVDSKLFFIPYN